MEILCPATSGRPAAAGRPPGPGRAGTLVGLLAVGTVIADSQARVTGIGSRVPATPVGIRSAWLGGIDRTMLSTEDAGYPTLSR